MGATGTATLNFGAFPGASDAVVDVAAAGVVSSSAIEAWIRPVATADHTVDEHMVETIRVSGSYLSDGNIRIRGFNTNQVTGPAWMKLPMPMLVGQFNVWWVWN
jgi:hypothetical protein